MSEFLARGWNTCTPDVDVGDDVLVLEDRAGQFKRVQVKTATATERSNGYSVQFNIPIKQLRQSITPEINYAFMIRRDDKWANTLIIKRKDLNMIFESLNSNTAVDAKNGVLYISFQVNEVKCSDVNFLPYVDNFSEFAHIEH